MLVETQNLPLMTPITLICADWIGWSCVIWWSGDQKKQKLPRIDADERGSEAKPYRW